jgi:prepilin-type processing-associated H-X9-DG protein
MSSKSELPPSKTYNEYNKAYKNYSLFVHLLQYLEQGGAYDKFDFTQHWSNAKNYDAVRHNISILICPSASQSPRTDKDGKLLYATDYAPCSMIATALRQHWFTNGYITARAPANKSGGQGDDTQNIFYRNMLVPPNVCLSSKGSQWGGPLQSTAVKDGFSNTFMLFECSDRPMKYEKQRLVAGNVSGASWADDESEFWLKKNDTCGTQIINCTNDNSIASLHLDGTNVLFGDGAVRFVSESISPETFVSYFTCNGGDIVSE